MTGKQQETSTTDDRSRWIALYVLCAGMLMIVLDATVVNVALPSIQDDLGFSGSSLAWVVNAYLIAFGGLLLLAGRLGDLLGRRNVLLAGLGVFTIASLLCGIAQTQEMLVAARFLQGVGGAMTSAVILGMIVTLFPDPREQAKAIGVYAFVASAGGSIGLLAGGVLTQAINWHWIFFVNIPIGIVTAVLATRLLERDRGLGLRSGADVPGALLITSALMLGVYTIVKPAAEDGWTAGATLGLGALAVALLAGFVAREATARTPLMPLRIFRSRNVAGANLVQVLAVGGMFGLFFLGALYLQRILGYDALQIGLAFLPSTVTMGVLSLRYSSRLVVRFGARTTLIPGLLLILAGLVLFTQAPVDGQLRDRRAARRAADRDRRRHRVPGPDDAGDVRRDAERRGPGLGPGQHDGAGRRRARPGRPGNAVGVAQRRPLGPGPVDGRGAHERLPPGLLDRRRARPRWHRRRAGDPAARPPDRGRAGRGLRRSLTASATPAGLASVAPPGRRCTAWGGPALRCSRARAAVR